MVKTVFRAFLSILNLLFCISCFAQTPSGPAPTPVFSVSSEAIGIHVGGQTVAGTDEIGSFNVKKNLWLQSDNLLFSSACTTCQAVSGQLYVAGAKYYSSYLGNLLGSTGVANGFTPYFHGGIGIYRNSPADGSAKNHFGALLDAGGDWNVNGTFSIGPRAGLVVAPGAGPNCSAAPCPKQGPLGWFVSADLKLNIGKILH